MGDLIIIVIEIVKIIILMLLQGFSVIGMGAILKHKLPPYLNRGFWTKALLVNVVVLSALELPVDIWMMSENVELGFDVGYWVVWAILIAFGIGSRNSLREAGHYK